MNKSPVRHNPVAIHLHQKSRILAIRFDDGRAFELPCEYLRVFSHAAEVRTLDQPVTGKEFVNITAIEPQGNYAVRLVFDDGHDTGLYSWDTLYQLGEHQAENWSAYLKRLEALGYQRQDAVGPRRVKLLYFAHLAQRLRQESEDLDLPTQVTNVTTLLEWFCRRKPEAAPLFAADQVRVTVNRQFAEPFTRLDQGDEIGLVPTSPHAPPTPDLF
jgi:DUF971 family protein/molybdopterin converting factor small subunit